MAKVMGERSETRYTECDTVPEITLPITLRFLETEQYLRMLLKQSCIITSLVPREALANLINFILKYLKNYYYANT